MRNSRGTAVAPSRLLRNLDALAGLRTASRAESRASSS